MDFCLGSMKTENLDVRSAGEMAEMSPPQSARFLVLFDFDETMVSESSDDAVVRAAPGQALPAWLRAAFRPGRYNEHMQRILAYLWEQGVTEESIRREVERIPATPGLPALLDFLRSHRRDFECVVLSDANTYFIEAWLQRAGARQLFLEVITNPASFDADGRLALLPFHSHGCPRCPENMCKQLVLQEYLLRRLRERGGDFQRVFYIGDGANDVCPSLVLREQDTALARRDFPMHRMLVDMRPGAFKASVVPWASGEDVVDCLRKFVEDR
uniref:Phosphatase phospho1 n=2 Tax=Denticeps clupeoides TaxID=299321 RepID=A0AAY4A265_9TELE